MALGWRDDYKIWALSKIALIKATDGPNYKTLFGKIREAQVQLTLPIIKQNKDIPSSWPKVNSTTDSVLYGAPVPVKGYKDSNDIFANFQKEGVEM